MTNLLIDGIGGSVGDRLVTERPLYMSGNVWYVNFATGTDAASPAGKERLKPLKTLSQANTNASDGDTIVFLSGHAEVLSGAITLTKELILVGEGNVSGVPQCTFQNNSAASSSLILSGNNIHLRNLRFLPNQQGNTGPVVQLEQTGGTLIGCRLESGDNNTGPVVRCRANFCRFENCTFVNVAVATAPATALTDATSASYMTIRDTVFDGGTIGYTNGLAADLSTVAQPSVRFEGITLMRGADMALHASTTGIVQIGSATGGGRLTWG